jgi:hypothetical protein
MKGYRYSIRYFVSVELFALSIERTQAKEL